MATNNTNAPAPVVTTTETETEKLKRELDEMKKENETLKANAKANKGVGTFSMKVSEKGGLSIYGLGRFPVTLYKAQWLKLLAKVTEILAFIEVHAAELKDGTDEEKAATKANTEKIIAALPKKK